MKTPEEYLLEKTNYTQEDLDSNPRTELSETLILMKGYLKDIDLMECKICGCCTIDDEFCKDCDEHRLRCPSCDSENIMTHLIGAYKCSDCRNVF